MSNSNNVKNTTGSTSRKVQKRTSFVLATFVCGLAALFYLYEFVLQVSPSVMTNQLMASFNIKAGALGAISAFYYYAYTPMQLPAGILYDRFGPRKVMACAILVCAMGALFFSMTHDVFFASLGRFFMGAGSAFSFIGVLLLISRWFPPQYFALLAGVAQFMSSIGAITGQVPLAHAIENYGWQQSMFVISLIGFGLALLVWLAVRDRPPHSRYTLLPKPKRQSIKGLKTVVKKSQTWFTGIYAFCSWAPMVIFAALWGVPYLARLYNVNTTIASSAVAMVWLGVGIGSPILGWYSDFIASRCKPLFMVQMIGFFASIVVLYVPGVPFALMYVFLFVMGFAASGQALSFGLVKDNNRPTIVGTAIGFNNMSVVAGGAILQPLAGYLIQYFWHGDYLNGIANYTANEYREAMFLIPLCYLIAIFVVRRFIRETHCTNKYETESEPSHEQNVVAKYEVS